MILQLTNPNNNRVYNLNVPEHDRIVNTSAFGTGTWMQDSENTWYGSSNGWASAVSFAFDAMNGNYIELPETGEQFVDTSISPESRNYESTVNATNPAGYLAIAFFTKTEYIEGQPVTVYFASTRICHNNIHDVTTRNKSSNNASYVLSGQMRPRISFDIINLRDSFGDLYPALIVSIWTQSGDTLQLQTQTFYSLSFFQGAEPIPGQSTTKTTTPAGGFGARINSTASIDFPDINVINQASVIQPNANAHGLHIYALTLGQYNNLYAEMWSTKLSRQLRDTKYSPMQGIGALHKMACVSPAEPTAVNIRLAGATLDTTGYIVQNQFVKTVYPYIPIERYSGTFLDFAPHTKISVHLPFIGTVPVDPDVCMGGGLQVCYVFDVLQGNCAAIIKYTNRFGQSDIYGTYTGNCAYQSIVSGSDNGFPAVRGAIQSFATGALDLAAGNYGGAALAALAGGMNLATADHSFSRVGNTGGNAAALGNTDLYITITMPQDVSTIDASGNYRVHNLGYAAAGGETVSAYAGHYVAGIVHADFAGATAAEKQEIENAIERGLFV